MAEKTPGRGCLWPMWPHSARPNHEYCGKQRTLGSSYCDEHRSMSVRRTEDEPERPFIPRKIAA